MITEVYFIEGLYLYREVGTSGRGVPASSEQGSQVQLAVPVRVKWTQRCRTLNWWWIFRVNIQLKGFKVRVAKENRSGNI